MKAETSSLKQNKRKLIAMTSTARMNTLRRKGEEQPRRKDNEEAVGKSILALDWRLAFDQRMHSRA